MSQCSFEGARARTFLIAPLNYLSTYLLVFVIICNRNTNWSSNRIYIYIYMFHTPPKMVNTRNITKKEMQKTVEEKKDTHHVRDESHNVEQHKVDKDDAGTQDTRTMLVENKPGPSAEKIVYMSTKKSSVCSSTLAKKKRLEAEAAEAKAQIRMELIDKKLEADLAELESSVGSCRTSSKKLSDEYKDRAVETWLGTSQQEVKTQCVTHRGINYDVLGPAPQESNLHHSGATGPQPLATEIALEARSPPAPGGTDGTVHALASALKDLAAVSAAGVNNSNDKMLSRLCTPRDLPLYSGDPLEWLQFKQAYEESSQVCNFSEKENLWRLRRSLQGPAKEAVTALLIGATSADVVMSTLELQFGNPDIIISRILQDITKLRPMAQEYFKDIIPFSVKVRNCVAAVTAIGCEDYLKGMNIVSVILSKLPTVLISKWTDYSYQFINDRNKPKLVILSEFLSEEAVKITKTSVNLFHVQSFSKQSYNDNHKTNRILLVNNEHSENRNSETCKYCHIAKHSLHECKKFKKSMRKDRWTYVKRNGLCYKCLKSKHKQNSCPAPACDVNDCGLSHHRLLHYTVKSVPCNNVNITDTTQTEPESPVETVNHITVNNNKILLKTVPIYLHGPNGTFRCFAILDDGSTVTLISEALASRTGLRGNKQSMRVCGAWNNSALLCQTEILNLNLSNGEGTKFTIRARSVKNLNLPEQNYADINLNNYELTSEIKNVICDGQCKPELLIGQDNYDLMLPLQIIKTKPNEPFFTRTPLGWCMHGRTRTSSPTDEETELHSTLLLTEESNTKSECRLRDLPGKNVHSTSVTFKNGQQHDGERNLGLICIPTDIPKTILTGENKPTEREMLRILISVLNVNRLLSPMYISGKIILQDTVRAGISWHDVIPEKIYLKWLSWLGVIILNHTRLPRLYASSTENISYSDNVQVSETHDHSAHALSNLAPRPSPYGERYTNLQLHVFCDASTQAMCAVAYWRWTDRENNIRVAFVSSKCRVAPVKYISMPHLKLQAAVMAGKLVNVISNEHRMKADRKYFWYDSSSVIYWICNVPWNHKAYINHWFGELNELMKVDEWRYILMKLNAADIVTRESCEVKTLKNERLYEPLFLYNEEQLWPRQLEIQQLDMDYVDLECINIIHNTIAYLPAVLELERFSSWLRLLKTICMLLCKKLTSCVDGAMMELDEDILLKYSQIKSFPDDLHNLQHNKCVDKESKLFTWTPVLHDYAVIRLEARVDAAPEISTAVKRPEKIGRCHVTHLIVKFYHASHISQLVMSAVPALGRGV